MEFRSGYHYSVEPGGCWVWLRSVDSGVPRCALGRADRVAYEDRFGTIATGIVVEHECNTVLCINPDHMRLVPVAHRRRKAKKQFSADEVRVIRQRSSRGETDAAIALDYDVHRTTIGRIVRGDRWKSEAEPTAEDDRKCLECGVFITHRRRDAQFCCYAHMQTYWQRERRGHGRRKTYPVVDGVWTDPATDPSRTYYNPARLALVRQREGAPTAETHLSGNFSAHLAKHLRSFPRAPVLFVGSGMSRRYLGLDDWTGLLARFAAYTDRPFARYRADSAGDNPRLASELAREFAATWWENAAFATHRGDFASELIHPSSPLKLEIARYMQTATKAAALTSRVDGELEALKRAQVDAVVTTNYDTLLEHVFPDFKPLVGQDDVLFSATAEIGEIYKIHGCVTRPNSLVLTAEDYDEFNRRNAYLAAKLLTLFVDHPVVFIGYSMQDPNVVGLLNSVAAGLSTEHLAKLQDRLIFVEWDRRQMAPTLEPTVLALDDARIPVQRARVARFEPVFDAMASVPRRLPVRVLRHLKEHVYNLVHSTNPVGSVQVLDLERVDAEDELDVVIGVGLAGKFGYLGLSREHLFNDVLGEREQYRASDVVEYVLPRLLRESRLVPVFRYLSAAGYLTREGGLREDAPIHNLVRDRVAAHDQLIRPKPDWYARKGLEIASRVSGFAELAQSEQPSRAVMFTTCLADEQHDPAALRDFLIQHRELLALSTTSTHRTHWAKALCLYDWLMFGRGLTGGRELKTA